jgi:hypothetical protein
VKKWFLKEIKLLVIYALFYVACFAVAEVGCLVNESNWVCGSFKWFLWAFFPLSVFLMFCYSIKSFYDFRKTQKKIK